MEAKASDTPIATITMLDKDDSSFAIGDTMYNDSLGQFCVSVLFLLFFASI